MPTTVIRRSSLALRTPRSRPSRESLETLVRRLESVLSRSTVRSSRSTKPLSLALPRREKQTILTLADTTRNQTSSSTSQTTPLRSRSTRTTQGRSPKRLAIKLVRLYRYSLIERRKFRHGLTPFLLESALASSGKFSSTLSLDTERIQTLNEPAERPN